MPQNGLVSFRRRPPQLLRLVMSAMRSSDDSDQPVHCLAQRASGISNRYTMSGWPACRLFRSLCLSLVIQLGRPFGSQHNRNSQVYIRVIRKSRRSLRNPVEAFIHTLLPATRHVCDVYCFTRNIRVTAANQCLLSELRRIMTHSLVKVEVEILQTSTK